VKSFDMPDILETPDTPRRQFALGDSGDEQFLLAPDKNSVWYFTLACLAPPLERPDITPWDMLYACHFSLDGSLIALDYLETRGRMCLNHPKSTYCALGTRSCGRDGLFAICFTSMPSLDSDDRDSSKPALSIIVFDETLGKLFQYKTSGIEDSNRVAIWKGVCISANSTHVTVIKDDGQQ